MTLPTLLIRLIIILAGALSAEYDYWGIAIAFWLLVFIDAISDINITIKDRKAL